MISGTPLINDDLHGIISQKEPEKRNIDNNALEVKKHVMFTRSEMIV
jgi:hypothetical protein